MNNFSKILFYILSATTLVGILFALDRGLAIGFLLFYFLSGAIFFLLHKNKLLDKNIYIIFIIIFSLHLSVVMFLYLSGVGALGGGADFDGYNQNAIEIASRFSRGDFSLQGLFTVHYFPVLIGIIYMFTLPEMIVGQFFTIWLAFISVILLYFICQELGASRKASLMATIIASFYPSHLYFGSLLLKDTLIIPIALACLFVVIKILKKLSALNFILFFILLTGLIHFRFYIGFAVVLSFIICWFFISSHRIWDKTIYGLTMVFILGFSFQLVGYGYYGSSLLSYFINKDVIVNYREVVYAPPKEDSKFSDVEQVVSKDDQCILCSKTDNNGSGSSFTVKVNPDNNFEFIKNYFVSFINGALGPFPWQLRFKRHLLFLAETIPLYLFLFLFIRSVVIKIREEGVKKVFELYRFTTPILIFAIITIAVLSLYINNFGIITRIRMPVYISLLSILALSLRMENVKIFNIKTWKNI